MKITYVTGNWAKVQSAKEKLEPYGIEIDNVKLDNFEHPQNVLLPTTLDNNVAVVKLEHE